MKLTIKPKAEPTVQRNLRVPVSLNKRMNDTTALADELSVDYHATLLTAIEQFNAEFDAKLREMKKSTGESPTTSGRKSIPALVGQPAPSIEPNPRKSLGQQTTSTEPTTYGNGRDKA